MIVRVEAVTDRESKALTEQEQAQLRAAVEGALPGRKVHVAVTRTNPRELDYGAIANLLAAARRDSGSLEDALRVVVHATRSGHSHVAAAGVNDVVATVAHEDNLRPETVLGRSKTHRASAARARAWWLLSERGLTVEAIASAFDRSKSSVSEALTRFRAKLEIDAELRARMTWAAADWRRKAA